MEVQTCRSTASWGGLCETWLLSAKHWLGSMEIYALLWQLMLISISSALSNLSSAIGILEDNAQG